MSPEALPQKDAEARQRQGERGQEEEKPTGEGGIGGDVELCEEVDEERLTHAESVDREG